MELRLIGIGMGALGHVTLDGMESLRGVRTILLPQKGAGKEDLAHLRERIIEASGTAARIVTFDYPTRDPAFDYATRVELWHDEIARRWSAALEGSESPVALLVWGDPSLYDSTLRIAARLDPAPQVRVIPGITALQALTAAHAIPLNRVNGPVTITTGRRLRDEGWPEGAETVAVMLDGECSFQTLPQDDLWIWWGAYLGMEEEVLHAGPLPGTTPDILATREAERARHGWIMDTYLLRRGPGG
ncbi:precorrin-6A synthase (deacetylating) [Palleronia caenipelagi]|uniref:Precorrin-6A synthase [deacetylating] n=1 Tax=Palleronia caenipelagi TaxID=2489174 RepID=A0A547Q2S1_9RHOB|nr:precorrin-6A synthase (deacetylating) [Palleronia caenipelagi]TRD20673.1 precorrin-6A synthase (deacetylating) [Palleronia caenipelagi]